VLVVKTWGSRHISQFILNLGSRWNLAVLPLGQELPTPTEQEAGWALEPIWMLQGREKSLAMPGIKSVLLLNIPSLL
jgi:hypothetical protein